jgi:wyosine [tRNA(Phe)-imidazoG37] synthetase (radical SAM superfamily)
LATNSSMDITFGPVPSRRLSRLQPDITYISIPTRPPADKNIRSADPEAINFAYQIMSGYVDRIELLTGYEGNAFSSTGDVPRDILNITAVHPMRKDAIEDILNKTEADWRTVDGLLQNNELIQAEFQGHTFFMRNF